MEEHGRRSTEDNWFLKERQPCAGTPNHPKSPQIEHRPPGKPRAFNKIKNQPKFNKMQPNSTKIQKGEIPAKRLKAPNGQTQSRSLTQEPITSWFRWVKPLGLFQESKRSLIIKFVTSSWFLVLHFIRYFD